MLDDLFHTGLQLVQMIALVLMLYGVFLLIGAVAGGRGPLDFIKGAGVMTLAVYLVGLGRGF